MNPDDIFDRLFAIEVTGMDLDRLGELYGPCRTVGESDDEFRERIKASVVSLRKNGLERAIKKAREKNEKEI